MASTPESPPWTSNLQAYEQGFTALFRGKPEDTETDVKRLFASTYTQQVDDKILDLAHFIRHIHHLRSVVDKVDIHVQQFLRDGDQIADRHTVHIRLRDGTEVESHVYLFGNVQEDGKMASVVETVYQVKGTEGTKDIGSRE